MHFFWRMRSAKLQSFTRAGFSDSRTQLNFLGKVFFCQTSFADSGVNGSFGSKVVSLTISEAEKEAAKTVLTLFLKKKGLCNAAASRTIKKSDHFIHHLVSRLHSVHKPRHLVEQKLTTCDIRDALISYLESLEEEYGNALVDVVERFPCPPDKEKAVASIPASLSHSSLNSKKLKATSQVNEIGTACKLRPQTLYLIELGMDLDQIKDITRRNPPFAYYSLEGKIRPLVEFLLDLGVSKSDIPAIFSRCSQLCRLSLSAHIIPAMALLESLGVEKKKWAKLIKLFPFILLYSRQKVKTTVNFLYEMGLSAESIGKILTRFPQIIAFSVEDKLRPTAEYFNSLGVDVAVLLRRTPQNFGLSMEANLKPVTEFFLGRGYSMEEVGTMISRFGSLYTLSLVENLIPKWEFFLTMGYPRSELVKHPAYFGYSLEKRIKPRYAVMKECGVVLPLSTLLPPSSDVFDNVLKSKLKKKLAEQDQSYIYIYIYIGQ